MNIFVTGATGYIGGSVAVRLLRDGHRIRGLVRSPFPTRSTTRNPTTCQAAPATAMSGRTRIAMPHRRARISSMRVLIALRR